MLDLFFAVLVGAEVVVIDGTGEAEDEAGEEGDGKYCLSSECVCEDG